MSDKFENHEVNEQNLEQAAGGKSSGGVAYICSNCRALVRDYGHDDGTPPPGQDDPLPGVRPPLRRTPQVSQGERKSKRAKRPLVVPTGGHFLSEKRKMGRWRRDGRRI